MGPGMFDDSAGAVTVLIAMVAVGAFGLGFLVHYVFF